MICNSARRPSYSTVRSSTATDTCGNADGWDAQIGVAVGLNSLGESTQNLTWYDTSGATPYVSVVQRCLHGLCQCDSVGERFG
jgi:hypothetical protein